MLVQPGDFHPEICWNDSAHFNRTIFVEKAWESRDQMLGVHHWSSKVVPVGTIRSVCQGIRTRVFMSTGKLGREIWWFLPWVRENNSSIRHPQENACECSNPQITSHFISFPDPEENTRCVSALLTDTTRKKVEVARCCPANYWPEKCPPFSSWLLVSLWGLFCPAGASFASPPSNHWQRDLIWGAVQRMGRNWLPD